MAIQQIGQSVTQGTIPVFYVPPPDARAMNPYAAYMSGFLQTRTPAAREKFKLELAAMKPVDRSAAIQSILDTKAGAIEAANKALVAGRRSSDDLAKTALEAYSRGSVAGMTQTGQNQRTAMTENTRLYDRQMQEEGDTDRALMLGERRGNGMTGEANDVGQADSIVQAIEADPGNANAILTDVFGVGSYNAGKGQFNRMSQAERQALAGRLAMAVPESDTATLAMIDRFAQGGPDGGPGGGGPAGPITQRIAGQRARELDGGMSEEDWIASYSDYGNGDLGIEEHDGNGLHPGGIPLPAPHAAKGVDINTDIGAGASFRTKGIDTNGDGVADIGGPKATVKASGVGMGKEERDLYKGIIDGRDKYDPQDLSLGKEDPTKDLLADLDEQLARLEADHGTVRPSPYGGLGGKLPVLPGLASVRPEAYEGTPAAKAAEAAKGTGKAPAPSSQPTGAPELGAGLGEVTDDDLAALEAGVNQIGRNTAKQAAATAKAEAPVEPEQARPRGQFDVTASERAAIEAALGGPKAKPKAKPKAAPKPSVMDESDPYGESENG